MLNAVPVGQSCFVQAIESAMPAAQRRRLAELGIRAGAAIRVAQRIAGGGVVVSFGSTRYALDKQTASQIQVQVQHKVGD